MAIIINLDVMMARRKIGLMELSGKVGITPANLSILKNNKAKAIRLETLDAICRTLSCSRGIFSNLSRMNRIVWTTSDYIS